MCLGLELLLFYDYKVINPFLEKVVDTPKYWDFLGSFFIWKTNIMYVLFPPETPNIFSWSYRSMGTSINMNLLFLYVL